MKKPAKYATEQKFTPPKIKKYKFVPLNYTNNRSEFAEFASPIDHIRDYMLQVITREQERMRTRQQSNGAAI